MRSTKSIIILILAIILTAFTFVGFFEPVFSLQAINGGSPYTIESYKIFSDISSAEKYFTLIGKPFYAWLILANRICQFVTMICLIIMIIDLILRMTNVKRGKFLDIIFKVNIAVLFLAALLMVVFGLLAGIKNSYLIGEKQGVKVALETGYYFQLPVIVGGILAMMTYVDKQKIVTK